MEAKPLRRCVYTVLLDGYEPLNEQPVAARSDMPFLCLTDNPDLQSKSWRMRQVSPLFGLDPIRSQREIKLRPQVYLPDFDASLYIDNSVLLSEPPERLFEQYFPASGFCILEHSFRDTLLDEFLEVVRVGLDDPGRIFEQLNHYWTVCPEILSEKPLWSGIMLRDHRNDKVRAMQEIWLAHVLRYSRRDQLSSRVAFRQAGLEPDILLLDNNASWFHSWPHTQGRQHQKGMYHAAAPPSPLAASARRPGQALDEQAQRSREFFASPGWRVAAMLCKRAQRLPRLARFVLRGLKFLSGKRR